MPNNNHLLASIWQKRFVISPYDATKTNYDADDLFKLVTNIHAAGDFYYYVFDIADQSINDQLMPIHGLMESPQFLQ